MARSPLLNIMVRSTISAAKSLRRDFGEVRHLQNSVQGLQHFIETAKKRLQKDVKQALFETHSEYGFKVASQIFGGKTIGIDNEETDKFFVFDPLFGQNHLQRGYENFGVSLIAIEENEPVAALFYEPITNELFTADKDNGAFQNDQFLRMHVSANFKNAFVSIEGNAIREKNRKAFYDLVQHIAKFTFPHTAKEHPRNIAKLICDESDVLISCNPTYAQSQLIKLFIREVKGDYKEYTDFDFPILVAGPREYLEDIDKFLGKE